MIESLELGFRDRYPEIGIPGSGPGYRDRDSGLESRSGSRSGSGPGDLDRDPKSKFRIPELSLNPGIETPKLASQDQDTGIGIRNRHPGFGSKDRNSRIGSGIPGS